MRFNTSFIRLPVTFFTAAAAAGLAPGRALAESSISLSSEPGWFEHREDNAWLQPYDPTLISRRILSEFSVEGFDSGEEHLKVENSFRWGFLVAEDLALGLQVMSPVKWGGTDAGDYDGIGDLELRTGFVGRFSSSLRWGVGLNVKLDTADDPAVGDGLTVLRPILAIRRDIGEYFNIGFNVEYEFTPEAGLLDDESTLQLKVPLAVRVTKDWSGAFTYKPRVDLLAESDRHRVEITATRLFGTDHDFGLTFGAEFPLGSEDFDHKIIAGMVWSF